MRALTFSLLRALSYQRFTSGTALAAQFGVSRSAVSAAFKEASVSGVEIFSLTRQGYRLAQPIDFIDLGHVHNLLGSYAARVDVDIVDTIESTNTELLRRASIAAPSGSALVAELQSAGRGRRGRAWQSTLGGSLTFSLLWRFDMGMAQLGGLSLVVGLAVKRALAAAGLDAQLKWPNDLWIARQKCGGILIETQGELMGPITAIIGIGVNVRMPEQLRAQIDQPVTDLASHTASPIERSALLAAMLTALVEALDDFARDGFAPFREEWIAAHGLHGEVVDITGADGTTACGRVIDIAANGALIVDVGGSARTLSAEEISLRPATQKSAGRK